MFDAFWCLVFIVIVCLFALFSKKAPGKMLVCFSLNCFCLFRLMQWYNLAIFFWGASLCRTIWDIITIDWIESDFLRAPPSNTYGACKGLPLEEVPDGIPSGLRWFSLMVPIAGVFAFVIVVINILMYIGRKCPQEFSGPCPVVYPTFPDEDQIARGTFPDEDKIARYIKWVTMPRTIMTLLGIGMPMVFVVMALRCNIRQWASMTCTAWKNPSFDGLPFDDVRSLEDATYTEDLDVASFFQFIVVLVFAYSCSTAVSYKEEKAARFYCWTLYIYTVVGFVKSVIRGWRAIWLAQQALKGKPMSQASQLPISTSMVWLDPVFLFATFIIVGFIFLLGKDSLVQEKLGNSVHLKLIATYALLLVGQVQIVALRWLFPTPIQQTRLLHSSLLCCECLVIALVNLYHQVAAYRKDQLMTAPPDGAVARVPPPTTPQTTTGTSPARTTGTSPAAKAREPLLSAESQMEAL